MTDRMRFGIFLAPFHKPGINPTLALEQDLELVQWLDRCDYDEVWFGEHHSAGSEISADPMLMIATAAQRTRRIKLGTGVVSVSYHNPLWVAERIVQLDHLTRGRAMLGVGPGSLPTDAAMVGLSQEHTRRLLAEGLDIMTRLIRTEEPVTFENERWVLKDARLHLRPYSNFDIATAAVASPTGPKLAGKYGTGLISIGATTAAGFDALALHWDVLAAEAAHHGHAVDRAKWRLVGLCHIADTMEQAKRDVEYGIEHWFHYFQDIAAFPQMSMPGQNAKEMIDFINDSGFGAIGTPEMCRAQIDRLWKQSNGGFGAYLLLAHNWANFDATRKSYDLIAREVFPHFQNQHHSTMNAALRAEKMRPDLAAVHAKAVETAQQLYAAETAARAH
jgi:limonene 1,2-monooxygenase